MNFYIIIRGPLGIGKSTIDKELSKKLNARYIAIDRIVDSKLITREKEDGHVSITKTYLNIASFFKKERT